MALVVFFVAAAAAPLLGAEATQERELPRPDVLELFGHEPVKIAAAESARELTRPETAAARAAAPAGGEQKLIDRRAGEAGGLRWRDWLPLVCVLALVAVLVAAVKRFLPARHLLGPGGLVQVLARTPLSNRQSLVLVRLHRRILLLGVCPGQVSTLAILDDPGEVATVLGELAARQPSSMTQLFRSALAEEGANYIDEESDSNAGPVRNLIEKVRSLRHRDVA